MTSPILTAEHLSASGRRGPIFGPLDLELHPRQLCIVHGGRGSGKSALLLALAARFRQVQGHLTIDGIDAIADPRAAMQITSVARLGNYVAPEDRLTISESVMERAFLDGIAVSEAEDRVEQMLDILGFRVDMSAEIESLSPVERAVAAVCLAMLKPSKVVVIDDADLYIPYSEQDLLFEIFQRLTSLDDSAIVAGVLDGGLVSHGAVSVALAAQQCRAVRPVVTGTIAEGDEPHTRRSRLDDVIASWPDDDKDIR